MDEVKILKESFCKFILKIYYFYFLHTCYVDENKI